MRYLIAICIGVAATLAWQSYGDVVKQTVATKAPEFGWSPEMQQLISATIAQLGWTKSAELQSAPPPAAPETAQLAQQPPIAQPAPDAGGFKASASPSPTLEQVRQIASDLTAVKRAVEQLSSYQGQLAQDLAKVQATDQEVLNKVSANKVAASNSVVANKLSASRPLTAATPARKYPPGSPATSGPPSPQPLPSR